MGRRKLLPREKLNRKLERLQKEIEEIKVLLAGQCNEVVVDKVAVTEEVKTE